MMNEQNKPAFKTWDHDVLARLANDLWDQNQQLREAVQTMRLEVLRLRDVIQTHNLQDDWK